MTDANHPVMLIVLDGWGHSDETEWNAIHAAHTPNWDHIWTECPHSLIHCSGTNVGLPDQQMGNSEVGHMHIGAGRLIDQDLSRISKAIADGTFAENLAFEQALATARKNKGTVHIFGLLSPGGVHSHEDHIAALTELAITAGAKGVCIHAFLDGRDTPPSSARASIERFEKLCDDHDQARIASVIGRYYAMDRNQNWDRIALAYNLLVRADAEHVEASALAALDAAYARDETDEFVKPSVILDRDGKRHEIANGDVVIFANFRADRARQITTALTASEFEGFARGTLPKLGSYVTMTDYGDQFAVPVAFPAIELPSTFGAVVAREGRHQLRIAETEKYAHVTFFFNGGEEQAFEGEERILVPSPDVATYDLKPEMSAPEVTARLCEAISEARYDAIICNFANADMVGHTGNFDATVRCIETLDSCLGQVLATAAQHKLDTLITADHGNAEKMRDSSSRNSDHTPHTAHTSNLVPLVYAGRPARMLEGGSLVDLAPTLLHLMGLEIPQEMTGRNLIEIDDAARDAAA